MVGGLIAEERKPQITQKTQIKSEGRVNLNSLFLFCFDLLSFCVICGSSFSSPFTPPAPAARLRGSAEADPREPSRAPVPGENHLRRASSRKVRWLPSGSRTGSVPLCEFQQTAARYVLLRPEIAVALSDQVAPGTDFGTFRCVVRDHLPRCPRYICLNARG